MINSSLQTELGRFFQVLHDEPLSTLEVTAAAFCQARKKLSFTAFTALNHCLIETFYQSGQAHRWHGYRLLAVDASVTKLPNSQALMSHFGKARPQSHKPACRLSQLYDVMNRLSVDVQVESHRTGEREMALMHLRHAQQGDLILYDRGYPALWLFKMHLQKQVEFCVRTKLDYSNEIEAFVKSRRRDAIVAFPCVEKSLRRCLKEGLSVEPLRIRLIKIKLPNGQKQVLMTSLMDKEQFPYECFQELYHLRWGVEEDYKVMKSRLTIENFTGQSVEAILQDIQAKVLTKNIAAVAMRDSESLSRDITEHRQLTYKLNFTQALGRLKDNIVRLLLDDDVKSLYEKLINAIAKGLSACRPGRKFSRKDKRSRRREKYPTQYKRVC